MTKSAENTSTLFFVNQPPEVIDQFRLWLEGTGVQCVVVEPLARAFSLVVRDDPWGVVLSIDDVVGEKLCAQIREDDLLEDLKVIALSKGSSSSQLTEHMFGPSSADVYGKLPLEDGIIDVWLMNQLSGSTDSQSQSAPKRATPPEIIREPAAFDLGEDSDLEADVEIELTSDLSVSREPAPVPESTAEERISRLELELFEQSEKMTRVNRNLLKNQLALQETVSQNEMLKAECERLAAQLLDGSDDEALRKECMRLKERLLLAEQALERAQKDDVDAGLGEVDSLSPQDLLGQIAALRQNRDAKVEQINLLHGELQLTRQAVEALQSRTQKAEARLVEAQDVGQLREQQMQREFVSLQRQISNGTRNIEIANHRETQLNQQLEQLRGRLKDVERLHQEERNHWLQKSEGIVGKTEKESELLKEIDVLTQALQAQLMGDTDGSEAELLVASLEGRLESTNAELEQVHASLRELEIRNAKLTQQLTEKEQEATGEESAQWKRQQQVLDSTLKALEESLARQDELEQQLEESNIPSTTTNVDLQQRVQDAAALNAQLQEQLTQAWDEVLVLKNQQSEMSLESDGVSIESHQAALDAQAEEYQQRLAELQQENQRLVDQQISNANAGNSNTGSDQMVLEHLQKAIAEIESQRKFIEEELEAAHLQVRELTEEQTRLQCALEDSQSMADAVEALTDEELANKAAEVERATTLLSEKERAYQDLEAQTALVITERDDMWSRVEALEAEQATLTAELSTIESDKESLEQRLATAETTMNEAAENVEKLNDKLRVTEEELTLRQEELAVLQAEADERTQGTEALESENQALSDQRQTLLLEQERLQQNVSDLEKAVEGLNSELQQTQELYTAAVEENKRLTTDLADMQDAQASQRLETSQVEAKLTELTDERDALQTKVASMEADLVTLQSNVDAAHKTVDETKAAYEAQIASMSASNDEAVQLHTAEISRLISAHEEALSAEQQTFAKAQADWETERQSSSSDMAKLSGELTEAQSSLQQLEDDRTRLSNRITELETQHLKDQDRSTLEESEKVASLTSELEGVRSELSERQETIDSLRTQLTGLQAELDTLRSAETDLTDLQKRHVALESELHSIQQAHLEAEHSWKSEFADLKAKHAADSQALQAEIDATQSSQQDLSPSSHTMELEKELDAIREQRANLLAEIERLTSQNGQKDKQVRELRQNGSTLVAELQVQRDDAQTELELLRLEMGIAQSAARQLAQQAERMRREVFEKEAAWAENLAKKDAENAQLRDRIERMERGLSSLFVKRPTF